MNRNQVFHEEIFFRVFFLCIIVFVEIELSNDVSVYNDGGILRRQGVPKLTVHAICVGQVQTTHTTNPKLPPKTRPFSD